MKRTQTQMVMEFSEMTMAMRRLIWAVAIGILLAPALAWAQSTDEVLYYHTDAIGSVRMITDATGTVIDRYDFLPFGERWAPPPQPTPDLRQFAGKERDAETGLDYFGARYYRAQSGRFTSVDPVLDVSNAPLNPQDWNRYTYALNNPFKYTDPDGRSATLVGGLIGGAVTAGGALIQGRPWREVGAAAAGGAVYGAMLGSVIDSGGASLPAVLGAGALAGVGGRLIENAINGQATTVGDAALSGLAGAAGVAAGELVFAGAQAMTRAGAAGVRASLTPTGELNATHGMTMSGREFGRLKADIARNGILNPIKYVEYNGHKFIVDGHHRLLAARALGIRNVPTQQVDLPYAGYRTAADFMTRPR